MLDPNSFPVLSKSNVNRIQSRNRMREEEMRKEKMREEKQEIKR